MSLQRQFEGSDVRMLLEEIRTTYGNEPTISRAETFRSGGLLGFFQREQFRLVVDAPDQVDSHLSGAPAPSSGRRTAAKRRKTGKHFASSSIRTESVPVAPQSTKGPNIGADIGADIGSYIDDPRPARSATAERGSLNAPSRRVAVDLFADVADSTEDKDFVTKKPEPARRIQEPVMADVHPTEVAYAPAPDAEADQDPSFEAVLSRVARIAGAPGDVADRNPGSHPIASNTTPEQLTGSEDTDLPEHYVEHNPSEIDVLGSELFLPTSLLIEDLSEIIDSSNTCGAGTYGPAEDSRGIASILRQELLRVGFDPESATRVETTVSTGATTLSALACLFETMPTPPRIPLRPGSLVVVVGPRGRATAEAARIAAEIGSDPSQVGLASPLPQDPSAREELLIRDAADAMELGPSLRRGRVGIVAIDSPIGATSTVWARHVLAALRPTLVFGVVDAMYKSEDVGRWVEALNGLDALVVDRLESTASPARVLSLAIPVLRLGDLPSTPARWVAAVADLLSDECLSIGAPKPSVALDMDAMPGEDPSAVAAYEDMASYATAPGAGTNGASGRLRKQAQPITWPQLVSTTPENAEMHSAIR